MCVCVGVGVYVCVLRSILELLQNKCLKLELENCC